MQFEQISEDAGGNLDAAGEPSTSTPAWAWSASGPDFAGRGHDNYETDLIYRALIETAAAPGRRGLPQPRRKGPNGSSLTA